MGGGQEGMAYSKVLGPLQLLQTGKLRQGGDMNLSRSHSQWEAEVESRPRCIQMFLFFASVHPPPLVHTREGFPQATSRILVDGFCSVVVSSVTETFTVFHRAGKTQETEAYKGFPSLNKQ